MTSGHRGTPPAYTSESLAEHLRSLGVRTGEVLVVHMSYRAVRPVAGGPAGVIAALRSAVGRSGTIVMPSWGDDADTPFDPTSTRVAADLGITADIFWRLPRARRSNHPHAFCAIGPRASEITRDPLPLPPHRLESPVGRAYELDGQILLLGVGQDANSTIHLAELLAHVPYGISKHCTVVRNGQAARVDYVENDHCCQRFALVDEWLRVLGLQREGTVGNARARLMDSRALVECVRQQLEKDPFAFLHLPEDGCAECDEARNWAYVWGAPRSSSLPLSK